MLLSVSVYVIRSFDLIAVAISLLLRLFFAVCLIQCRCLCLPVLLSGLSSFAFLVSCFLFVSLFSVPSWRRRPSLVTFMSVSIGMFSLFFSPTVLPVWLVANYLV